MNIKIQTASEVKNSNGASTLAHETRKNKQWLTLFVMTVTNQRGAMESRDHFNGANPKSHRSRVNYLNLSKKIALLALITFFSSCSVRLVDFTVISSKNHSLKFELTNAKTVEGMEMKFFSTATIKGALDNALENAGPGYDLLIDGVLYARSGFFMSGYTVKGTAVRSRDLVAQLGETEFRKWFAENNVFDPATAKVEE